MTYSSVYVSVCPGGDMEKCGDRAMRMYTSIGCNVAGFIYLKTIVVGYDAISAVRRMEIYEAFRR
jgi:hypothetical protein